MPLLRALKKLPLLLPKALKLPLKRLLMPQRLLLMLLPKPLNPLSKLLNPLLTLLAKPLMLLLRKQQSPQLAKKPLKKHKKAQLSKLYADFQKFEAPLSTAGLLLYINANGA